MKAIVILISLLSSVVYADVVPYNLCADKTKTDCETLHMPSLGQIDNKTGHQVFSCGDGCPGSAEFKASSAVTMLVPKAGDFNYSHYITYESNPENIVYLQEEQGSNNYERVILNQENDLITFKYCTFSSDNISATIEKYKKEHNVQAGAAIIDLSSYNELKTAFQTQEDKTFCQDLN